MELLFLGTSSGTPTRARNVSGLALLAGQGRGWYLVDCGEATQHQVLRTPLTLQGLAGVFITHVHGDHCYGLPGLLASAGLQGRTRPLDIIAPEGIERWLRGTFELTHTWLPYELRFHATEALQTSPWRNDELQVSATALAHRVPSYGYRFTEAAAHPRLDRARLAIEGVPRGPAWGQLLHGLDVHLEGRLLRSADFVRYEQPPHCLVIAGDNSEPERLTQACKGAQVLVHEATYTRAIAEGRAHYGHSTAAGVAEFAAMAGLPNLVLTHFSPRYQMSAQRGLSIEDLRAEAAACYQGNLILAADYDRFRLTREGLLLRMEANSNTQASQRLHL